MVSSRLAQGQALVARKVAFLISILIKVTIFVIIRSLINVGMLGLTTYLLSIFKERVALFVAVGRL